MDFRSLGGILFLTFVFLVIHTFLNLRVSKTQGKRKQRYILFVIGLILSGWAVITIYSRAAESGLLGYEARLIFELQSAGVYGVFLGGRSEFLASTAAIMDSPILGHGSWAKDCQYTDILMETKRRLGYFPDAQYDNCLIPTHSILLGAWVDAGLLGAVLWLWVGFITAKALIFVIQNNVKFMPLIVFFGFVQLWDLAFSPYGAGRRFTTTFFIVITIMILNTRLPTINRQS